MNVYMYIDGDELKEIAEAVVESLTGWIGEGNEKTSLVNDVENDTLGIQLVVEKKPQLKKPLNFLFSIAKEHKCDFVVGIICPDTGAREDVCYFGHEEGRPDMFEIGTYLGL